MRRAKQLMAAIRTNYGLVMDPDKNPLWNIHPAQRFQVMAYLSVMWTTIFCTAFGAWYWYGELILAHMLVILGIAMTGLAAVRGPASWYGRYGPEPTFSAERSSTEAAHACGSRHSPSCSHRRA